MGASEPPVELSPRAEQWIRKLLGPHDWRDVESFTSLSVEDRKAVEARVREGIKKGSDEAFYVAQAICVTDWKDRRPLRSQRTHLTA